MSSTNAHDLLAHYLYASLIAYKEGITLAYAYERSKNDALGERWYRLAQDFIDADHAMWETMFDIAKRDLGKNAT